MYMCVCVRGARVCNSSERSCVSAIVLRDCGIVSVSFRGSFRDDASPSFIDPLPPHGSRPVWPPSRSSPSIPRCTRPFTQCARLQCMYTPTVGAHLGSLCMRALPHFGLGILAIPCDTVRGYVCETCRSCRSCRSCPLLSDCRTVGLSDLAGTAMTA